MRAPALSIVALVVACKSEPGSVAQDASAGDSPALDARAIDVGGDAASEDYGIEDAGFEDAGFADASPIESGVDAGLPRDPCGAAGGACTSPVECGTPQPGPSNCDSCVAFVRDLCIASSCTTPPDLEAGDVYELTFNVDPGVPRLMSLVWMAVAAQTPAGFAITCDEIYAGAIDLTNACYNVLDVRYREILQPGDTYSLLLGTFASGQHTLFIVFGYEQTRGRGSAAGVSCIELDVGAPGSGVVRFQGGPMRSI